MAQAMNAVARSGAGIRVQYPEVMLAVDQRVPFQPRRVIEPGTGEDRVIAPGAAGPADQS
jgi:hypothetical protein